MNVAVYLTERAAPGQILVGEGTFERCRGQFVTQQLEPVKLRGRSALVQPYEVLS